MSKGYSEDQNGDICIISIRKMLRTNWNHQLKRTQFSSSESEQYLRVGMNVCFEYSSNIDKLGMLVSFLSS